LARPPAKHPTELELAILQILWSTGPLSCRDVQAALNPPRTLAYTSVITMLNIMTRKGYLTRKKSAAGSFIYSPKITERATTGRMLSDLLHRVFHGSASALVLKLLEDKHLKDVELKELRRLVDKEESR
jgi:BlaI family transcriptional regulator, penicillinase repressor